MLRTPFGDRPLGGRLPRFSRQAGLLHRTYFVCGISFYGLLNLLMSLYCIRLGHSPQYMGAFLASGTFAFMVGSIPNGALGQKIGLRPMLVAGVGTVALQMGLMPLAEFLPGRIGHIWPILMHLILGYGWSMFNVNIIPAMAAVTTVEERSQAYSVNWALLMIGTLVGNLLGGFLPGWFATLIGVTTDSPAPYRLTLWVGAAIMLVAFWPVLQLDKDLGRLEQRPASQSGDKAPWRVLVVLTLVMICCQAGIAAQQFFGTPYLDTSLGVPTSVIGTGASVAQVLAVLVALGAPWLTRRWGTRTTLAVAPLLVALLGLPLAYSGRWLPVLASMVLIRVLSAVWMPAFQHYQMEQVDEGSRGLMAGATNMASGVAYSSVSFAGGYVIAAQGYPAVFLAAAVISLLGAFLVVGTRWLLPKGH